jgi:hypothetical protein
LPARIGRDRENRQSLWKRCGKVLLLKVAKGISQPATQHSSGVEQKRAFGTNPSSLFQASLRPPKYAKGNQNEWRCIADAGLMDKALSGYAGREPQKARGVISKPD